MPTFSPEQRLAIAVGVPTLALLLFLWYRRRQREESFDDEEEEEAQEEVVATAFETTIEVQIPQYLVGTVIGRGGANIKQIQKESGAYLRFKDEENDPREETAFQETKPETDKTRTVIIKGEREKARKAEFLIKKIISEQPKILTEEYYVPQRSCGRIIGRGGMTIRQLSKLSGARITISRDETRPDVPRKCTIVGTADQIASAKGLLDEKIAEHEEIMAKKKAYQARASERDVRRSVVRPKSSKAESFPYTVQYPDSVDFVEVFVSAVDTPVHFFVQLVRTDDAQKLERLIDTLTDEAKDGTSEDIIESIEVGMYCSAPFVHDDSRYRAKVTQINNDGTVSLYYVDYGDTGVMPKYKLHKLKEEYLQLPFQAVECFLANTKTRGDSWADNATDDFEKLVHYPDWVGLMARVVKYCGDVPCVELFDTSTDKDVFINQEMINRGYAVEDASYPPEPTMPEPDTKDEKDKSSVTPDVKPLEESEIFTMSSPPTVDEVDTKQDLDLHVSGPIDPDEFSPIKSALVKRVSKDYIETPNVSKDTGNQATVGSISEESSISEVVQEPIISADVSSLQAETPPGVDLMTEVKSSEKDFVTEVESTENDAVTEVTDIDTPKDVKSYEKDNTTAVEELVIAADSGSQVESAPEIDFGPEVKLPPAQDDDFIAEVKATSEVESPTETSRSEEDGGGFSSPNSSKVLKPEVREMIEIEVGQAFESQLTHSNGILTHSIESDQEKDTSAEDVTPFDTGSEVKNVDVEHVESTLEVEIDPRPDHTVTQTFVSVPLKTKADNDGGDDNDGDDDDDDDELETFTSTLQRQVHSKKTFVSSVTVSSNHSEKSTVTIVPTEEKEDGVTEDVLDQSSKRSYAQAAQTTQKHSQSGTKTGLLTGSEVEQLAGSHGDSVADENTMFELQQQGVVTSETNTDIDVTMTTVDGQSTTHVIETTNEKAPITTAESSLISVKNELSKSDRASPVNFDSDSESYVSALEEPASDTDSMSYYDTAADHISSSTTSLDYLTPGADTDTDTLRPHGDDVGTPVNSDTDDTDDDDEYDSDDEGESEAGNRTPKRKDSSECDEDLATTPKAAESAKQAARYLSDMDLGYRGDVEDMTESREDIR